MCHCKVFVGILLSQYLINTSIENEITASASAPNNGNPVGSTSSMSAAVERTEQIGTAVASFSSATIDDLLPDFRTGLRQKVTIRYDATDKASQEFLISSFSEMYALFRPFIAFYFIPCQNIQVLNGKLMCFGQQDHECFLNKLHSCATAQVMDEQALAQFIVCTMQNFNSFPNFADCAQVCGLDYASIEACANSDLGLMLCRDYRAKKEPNCSTLPRFSFDHSDVNLEGSTTNLANVNITADYKEIICARLRSKKVDLPEGCDSKIIANIYLESMTPESQNTIQALSPIYNKFSSLFTLKFFPCALAQYKKGKLTCPDKADKDCLVGKMHSCAAQQIKDGSILLKFLSCTMSSIDVQPDFKKCAEEAKIDHEALKKCGDSDLGLLLCIKNSKSTPVPNVQPIYVFNWNFNQRMSDQAIANPTHIFCQQLRNYNITYPEGCEGSINLSIYYDALDSNFRQWFAETMRLYYDQFSRFLTFEFIACRNAKESNGELKCYGNDKKCQSDKTESCAMRLIPDQIKLATFFLCIMQNCDREPSPYETCAQLQSIDFKPIKECADSDKGRDICTENIKLSPESEQNFVFVFNYKFDDVVSQKTFENFQRQVCQTLFDNKLPFPNECDYEAFPEDKQ